MLQVKKQASASGTGTHDALPHTDQLELQRQLSWQEQCSDLSIHPKPSLSPPHPPLMLVMCQILIDSLGFVVLKLNVKTVLNAHLHLERVDHIRERRESIYCQVSFLHQIRQTTYRYHTEEISEKLHTVRGQSSWGPYLQGQIMITSF